MDYQSTLLLAEHPGSIDASVGHAPDFPSSSAVLLINYSIQTSQPEFGYLQGHELVSHHTTPLSEIIKRYVQAI